MAVGFESFVKVGNQNEKKIVTDIVTTCSEKGEVSFTAKGAKYLMYEYPMTDQSSGKEFGWISNIYQVEKDKLKICSCDLTINASPMKLRVIKRLPASNKIKEYYLVENTSYHTPPFVIETVNRFAVWDAELVGKEITVGLSAFAGRIVIYDSLDDFNQQLGIFPIDTPDGQITGFGIDTAIARSTDDDDPYTVFLGKVINVKDVKVKLIENGIEMVLIDVDCFLGTLTVVAGRDAFDLIKLEKGKILEISAWIKADLGIEPTPEAIVYGRTKKRDEENVDNAVTRMADMGYDVSSELSNKIKKTVKKITRVGRKKSC